MEYIVVHVKKKKKSAPNKNDLWASFVEKFMPFQALGIKDS